MRYKQLLEGVKFGQKEIHTVYEHSDDFQMGIEYEVLTPNNSEPIEDAKQFIKQYNITNVESVKPEHSDMAEIITHPMGIKEGLKHINHFFASATQYGMTFPSDAGLHISISHKQANSKRFNYAKFLVLLSAGYIHTIFPERTHVEDLSENLALTISGSGAQTVDEAEQAINRAFENNSGFITHKTITAKLSDYATMNGRVELRFFGGKDYHTMYDNIRWQLLRSVYILEIALNDKMYRKEYLKQLYKLVYDINIKMTPSKAMIYLHSHKDVSPAKRRKLENIIATDAFTSMDYATVVIKDRFEKGEPIMSQELDDKDKEKYRELTGVRL